MHQLYAKALSGERQVVFVTGEAGIGKTALVETFLAQVNEAGGGRREASPPSSPHVSRLTSHVSPLLIGRGQCVEQHGAGEGYLPVLEALSRMCRHAQGDHVIDVLERVAPTWLIQRPTLLTPDERAALQQRTAGATRERMLREITDALETLSIESPLLLVLEDLHWSDTSTIEMLSLLARRREPVRLFVLCTYRPVEAIIAHHAVRASKQDLVTHGLAVEIPLGCLGVTEVQTYLGEQLGSREMAAAAAGLVYGRTGGHPLFMVHMTNHLALQEGTSFDEVAAREVPPGVQDLIELQISRLPAEEQRVLEASSIAGVEFAAASVAAGVQMETKVVDACCEGMVRQGWFLEDRGLAIWPDGTVSGRYGFRHTLYQEVLYRRLTVAQQARGHLRIGKREEAGYGERGKEIATELALHFERGQDDQRAAHYHQQAADTALQRHAYQEAIDHIDAGLRLLRIMPDTPARARQELRLHVVSGIALIAAKGCAAPDVERAYMRALALGRQLDETAQLFFVLRGLELFYRMRGEFQTAYEVGKQLLSLAQRLHDPAIFLAAHNVLSSNLCYMGDFTAARAHIAQGLTFATSASLPPQALTRGHTAVMEYLYHETFALAALGYPDQALKKSHEALTAARKLSPPLSLTFTLFGAAHICQLLQEDSAARTLAEESIHMATQWGFPHWRATGSVVRGWALVVQGQETEGIELMHQGLEALRAPGTQLTRPYFLALLADGYKRVGQREAGLRVLEESLTVMNKTGEQAWAAYLYQLKGELMLLTLSVVREPLPGKSRKSESPKSKKRFTKVTNPPSPLPTPQWAEAEACFLTALDIARRQEAKLFELRATVSLARLWQQQGKTEDVRQMLAEVYGEFTEGFDTVDLQAARMLLDEL